MGNCVRKESSSSDISTQFNKAPMGYPHHHAMPGPSHQSQFAMQGAIWLCLRLSNVELLKVDNHSRDRTATVWRRWAVIITLLKVSRQ